MTRHNLLKPPSAERILGPTGWAAIALLGGAIALPGTALAVQCDRTITANVVVLDNPTVFNRLGAQNPNWITYALRRDVIDVRTGLPESQGGVLTAGFVALRPDKRPRPLVVRSAAGDCLTVNFQNLLAPIANPNNAIQDNLINNDQVADRRAGFHAQGVELLNNIGSDGSFVGTNTSSLVAPGGTITYNLYTPHEGTFTVNSYGATIGGEASSGNLGIGMFGQLNVEPVGARMYRSIVTEEEMRLATVGTTDFGQPIIDYEATYPATNPDGSPSVWALEGKAGLPVLNMLTAGNELVHSDINAMIVGPNTDGSFPPDTYPLESVGNNVPSLPNRLEPFREFSSIFHDEQTNSQVFPRWYGNPVLNYTLAGVKDQFMINYGSGGIGSEIIANRLHTGPMHDCTDCAYEEFFLASQTVGDPGMLVNFPANTGIEQCDPTNILTPGCWRQFAIDADVNGDGVVDPNGELVGANPPIPGNFALFQEDPSNVHHSYTGDFVKIRNTHAGAFEQHIFHLHQHQWLFNPNDDNANYLDAQEIMPGSGHTYELTNGGAGNRNKTAGDAIFHCHFYPHFAQGMWYHIRIQDTFEKGSLLAISAGADQAVQTGVDATGNPILAGDLDGDGFHDTPFALRVGKPAIGARALPDGELPDGIPIPAIVPLPGKAMPMMPAKVSVVAVDRGDFGVLSGRRPANGVLAQGPDSAQAVVKIDCDPLVLGDCDDAVAGADGALGTADDLNPGFPFWAAGNSCGAGAVPNADPALTVCPEGTVGQRMPTPPLDMLTEAGADHNGFARAQAGGWDGGLPRHNLLGYTAGGLSLDTQNRLDFRKVVEIAQPVYFPEVGTVLERVAMADHAVRERPSFANNLADNGTTPAILVKNGAPPVPGGPYQDPCIDDMGRPLTADVTGNWFDGDGNPATMTTEGKSDLYTSENPRTYRIANVQIDAVFNKVGWHYPQERIIALWDDVAPTIAKQRPPEPLVMRFNTFDCGRLLHTNLVPAEFELDDFQVRTPTDIIGQHIHLPKWDLTTNDGAANGWNYEDGTLAPAVVEERIHAINNFNAFAAAQQGGEPAPLLTDVLAELGITVQADLAAAVGGHVIDLTGLAPVPTIDTGDPGSNVVAGQLALHAEPHPFFGTGVGGACDSAEPGEYCGARTTIQRILVDPVINVAGVDRGLGLTFSHDHYGPSTFQQIGLYSTILAEPAGSTWKHNESGGDLYGRPVATTDCTVNCTDGGPTTWQAIIKPPAGSPVPEHREFYFEMSDFQHAYEPGVYIGAGPDGRPIENDIIQPLFRDVTTATAAPGPDAISDIRVSWQQAINPPLKLKSVPFPDVVTAEAVCPGPAGNADPNVPRPCAEAINISHSSMFVVNYRNEPVGLRVFDPNGAGPDGKPGTQSAGLAGDLAFAFQSRTDRAIAQLNTSFGAMPAGYRTPAAHCQGVTGDGINCDRRAGDPITPIMRAYQGDDVKVKIQVGATEEQHQTTIHGMKWLSNGSGFGRAGNSGWRNFQSHGISEQFSLQVPITPVAQQLGNSVDYLYAQDATRDGIWLGTWGVLRAYGNRQQDLFQLTGNPQRGNLQIANQNEFTGVCPQTNAALTEYDVTAVLANEVLPNVAVAGGVTISPNTQITIGGVVVGGDSDGDGIGDNVGGPLDPLGGTLVYNRRGTVVPTVPNPEAGGNAQGGTGPLNDPTAILYVRTADLVFDTACIDPVTGNTDLCRTTNGDPIGLQPGAPVEPLVLRANAGDCIEVTLRNALPFTPVIDPVNGAVTARVPDPMPDLAGWQDMMWVVNRDLFNPVRPPQMHFFNNNLIRPSAYVGLHAQLVAYDASRDDGVLVGQNAPGQAVVEPGSQKLYRWYAGDLKAQRVAGQNANQRRFQIIATPVEFGGTNLLSADRIKQPQKGLFGALVIEPAGATVTANTQVPDGQGTGSATRLTRAQVDVSAPAGDAGSGGNYREALAIGHKITNLRWADGSAIANVNQNELGREGAEDSGHAGFNYGMEPSWFRFKLPPDVPFGNAGTPNSFGSVPNAHEMYANLLVAAEPNAVPLIAGVSAAGDPQTPVFTATRLQPARMHVLNGASADRDGTFMLHGHLWQRDPYVCTGTSQDDEVALAGRCDPAAAVPSMALGDNPQAKYMGAEEGMGHVYGHWPILLDSAGGTDGILGDYLYRDYAPNGNRNGQFGILRVE